MSILIHFGKYKIEKMFTDRMPHLYVERITKSRSGHSRIYTWHRIF